MTKRNKPTSEEELQDAIDRIAKKPESKNHLSNRQDWINYLTSVLHITPETIQSDKNQFGRSGVDFWENVRQGISTKYAEEIAEKHNVKVEHYGDRDIYRDNKGRFVSRKFLGLPDKDDFRKSKTEPSEHDLALAMAYKSTDKLGRISYRDGSGRFVKIVRYDDNGEEIKE